MEPANLTKSSQASSESIGELVLQNGRQAGTRRPLTVPTTFIGRGLGCDIRLNVDGVDSMHCVVVQNDGVVARDLNSSHGTFVNGERITSTAIRHGDVLSVGPFQFRVELYAGENSSSASHGETTANAMHVQVAAVAAQQVALEEEEARLLRRQNDLHLQEQQLANHLAEKQQQIETWSEQTQAEREELRRHKAEQHALFSQWESDLNALKDQLAQEQQQLIQERQRILKVYQRLRQRWQRQWSAAKQQHLEMTARMEADSKALQRREEIVRAQDANFAQEVRRFNTERELTSRQQHDAREEFKKAQAESKRRRDTERTLAKARQKRIEEATAQMHSARSFLEQERAAWEKQKVLLQKELHGLNNRVVHQRHALKDQQDRLALLDQQLREKLLQTKRLSALETGSASADERDSTSEIVEASTVPGEVTHPISSDERSRWESLDRLAAQLADQRIHLVEQYKGLAEIQEAWTREREQAAQHLEIAAQKLIDKEETLSRREQETVRDEEQLRKERAEVQSLRHEIHVCRSRLQAREQIVEHEQQAGMETLRRQEALVRDQLAALTQLRQRWNRRRQEEIEQMRGEQTRLQKERQDLRRLRQEIFDKGQHVAEEKRILAEKVLAVEQYRLQMLGHEKDPVAERRLERLRRRWLTQNAGQIRHAKQERESASSQINDLQSRIDQWGSQLEKLAQLSTVLAEQQSALEERHALLRTREKQVEQEIARSEAHRQNAEEKYARIKDEMENFAKAIYEEPDAPKPAMDRAA